MPVTPFDLASIEAALEVKIALPKRGATVEDILKELVREESTRLKYALADLHAKCKALNPEGFRFPLQVLQAAQRGEYPEHGLTGIHTLDAAKGWIQSRKDRSKELRSKALAGGIRVDAEALLEKTLAALDHFHTQCEKQEKDFFSKFGIEEGLGMASYAIGKRIEEIGAFHQRLEDADRLGAGGVVSHIQNNVLLVA